MHKEKIKKSEKLNDSEGIMTMLASEEVLKKDWDNEEDKVWNSVPPKLKYSITTEEIKATILEQYEERLKSLRFKV